MLILPFLLIAPLSGNVSGLSEFGVCCTLGPRSLADFSLALVLWEADLLLTYPTTRSSFPNELSVTYLFLEDFSVTVVFTCLCTTERSQPKSYTQPSPYTQKQPIASTMTFEDSVGRSGQHPHKNINLAGQQWQNAYLHCKCYFLVVLGFNCYYFMSSNIFHAI